MTVSAGAGLIVLDGRVQVPLQAPVGGYLCQPAPLLASHLGPGDGRVVAVAPYDDRSVASVWNPLKPSCNPAAPQPFPLLRSP